MTASKNKDTLFRSDILPERGEVVVSRMEATYIQTQDDCDDARNGYQELRIFTEDAGAGNYFVIETGRWAFESIDELANLLRDFEKRMNNKQVEH